MTDKYISRPEEFVLLAVRKLKENAYGITIRKSIEETTGKYRSIGAVYVPP
jgi:PadR family transcriptional regulator PadR